jgi:DNA-binding NarL/FixJ family response regulator
MKARLRVMIVEDHALVRQGIVALLRLEDEFEVVAEVSDGEQALPAFRAQRPDVTLVDLRLPRRTGVDVIRALRAEFPGSRFLVLTTFDGEQDVSRALHAGAQGYLLKGMDRDTLVAAIRAVHAGKRYIPQAIADRLLPAGGDGDELSPREREVLTCIASGMTNREIADELTITESTVKAHVNSLLSKLGVTDRTKALVVAVRRGLVRLE